MRAQDASASILRRLSPEVKCEPQSFLPPPTFVARALGWVCLCVLSLYSCDKTSQLRQLREKRVDLGHSFRARGPYGGNNLAAGADLRLSREPRVENSHLELQA